MEIAVILLSIGAILSAVCHIVTTSTTKRLWQQQRRQQKQLEQLQKDRSES